MVVLAAAAGVSLCSCNSYQGNTIGAQVRSWAATVQIVDQLQTVRADSTQVTAAESDHDAAAVRTECNVLSQDTLGAHQLLPSPDPSLTAGLDQALSLEESAAGHCYESAGGGALLAQADGERARAAIALGAALEQLATFGVPTGSS